MHEPLRFLLTDDYHLNRRNFAPLFDLIKEARASVTTHTGHAALKRALGSYESSPELAGHLRQLRQLDDTRLFELTHCYRDTPLRLFPLYRAELLAFTLTSQAHWHERGAERDEELLFERLLGEDRELLLHNAAAAMFWIEQFAPYFGALRGSYSHAFVFGGSLTYTRVVMEMCKRSETRCMVLETSFTGHQFYLEERYAPLAASADIRHPTIRQALWQPLSAPQREEHRARSVRMMHAAKNKNVVQPRAGEDLKFADPLRPQLLLVGQVVNDFSLIEQRHCPLSSLHFYKQLIEACLERTDYNIVFKAHPWEQRKQHLRHPYTFDELSRFRAALPVQQRARVQLTVEHNILSLGRLADRVALLNSQAGLELAFHTGVRVATFGNPYYAAAGFTDDFAGIEQFLADTAAHGHRRMLDLAGYDSLLDFLACFLSLYCVSDGSEGVAQLAARLPRDSDEPAPRSPSDRPLDRLGAKGRKLLRDPRRFVRDSRLLRRLLR